MEKIMLVLDNKEDQNFLEKVLVRLRYKVIAMRQGVDLSEQLIDHFPDVVFASTLGRNEKILSALGKIKQIRGKPKLVFVRQEKENSGLSSEQKKIIDGVLYSPVDPFKLIDILSTTTEMDIVELRQRYNEMLEKDRSSTPVSNSGADEEGTEEDSGLVKSFDRGAKDEDGDYGSTTVIGKGSSGDSEVVGSKPPGSEKITVSGGKAGSASSALIFDQKRKKKYDDYLKNAGANKEKQGTAIDIDQLRASQSAQAKEVSESSTVKENRKHFLKTLFSLSPDEVKNKG